MLDPRQDRAVQNLARSIAHSIEVLGSTCTARLLGSISLGLLDTPESDQSTETKGPADDSVLRSALTQLSRPLTYRQRVSNQGKELRY